MRTVMNTIALDVRDCRSSTADYPTFSERMRPRCLSELTLQSEKIVKLQKMLDTKNVSNMIFFGKPGTGKTTCADLIANNEDFEVLRLNASMTNSVDDIRNIVDSFASSISLWSKKKIIIFDEADFLSKNSQAALRGIVEERIDNCRFIFTANDFNKIDPALKSRCYQLSFNVIFADFDEARSKTVTLIENRLREISIEISKEKISEIVNLHFPDFRSIANTIDFELL